MASFDATGLKARDQEMRKVGRAVDCVRYKPRRRTLSGTRRREMPSRSPRRASLKIEISGLPRDLVREAGRHPFWNRRSCLRMCRTLQRRMLKPLKVWPWMYHLWCRRLLPLFAARQNEKLKQIQQTEDAGPPTAMSPSMNGCRTANNDADRGARGRRGDIPRLRCRAELDTARYHRGIRV